MDRCVARAAEVSDLSAGHGVSRKFVYQQADKTRRALDDAFIAAATDDTAMSKSDRAHVQRYRAYVEAYYRFLGTGTCPCLWCADHIAGLSLMVA
jgi:hypothetical protein